MSTPAPAVLLQRLQGEPGVASGRRRLVLLLSQLGDFDSMEYAQALVPVLPRLEAAGIAVLAIAIGTAEGRQRFCHFTGFPAERLQLEDNAALHRSLKLSPGLESLGGPWPNLLAMCAGISSPSTLAEVWRGCRGDRAAPARFRPEETIQLGALPPLSGRLFDRLGAGYQRPFELATVRLRNMMEVLGHWRTYVPNDAWITQRGGTFLLDADDTLLYAWQDRGILGFSATMARPLAFLDPWLPPAG